jgi:hypothetical protein
MKPFSLATVSLLGALISLRTRIGLVVLWVASLVAVGVWAQSPPQPEQKVISGNDLGYRVERIDRTGKPVGTLVVRINGQWVEAGFAAGWSRITQ